MNGTPLAQLFANPGAHQVLYGLEFPGGAIAYTVRGGVLYQHRADDNGYRHMHPQASDRAAWARVARVCAFTVPANPGTMRLGPAGERLGAFWRGLPDVTAEGRVSGTDLLAVVTAQP